MDGYQLKKVLDQIVDKAYPDLNERDRKKYHAFYVKLVEKKLKSKNGDYVYTTHVMRIFGIRDKAPARLIKTSIHELSHHIDWCIRGRSDHQKPFYEVYRRLLYASLDLGLLNVEEFVEEGQSSRDFNKVCKMLQEYRRKRGEYKSDLRRIDILNGYDFRAYLKDRGYSFDAVTKCWYIEVPENDVDAETAWLDWLGPKYEICASSEFHFKRKGIVPSVWCCHEFTDDEKNKLQAGEEIRLDDCCSRKTGREFKCIVRFFNGRLELVEFVNDEEQEKENRYE